MHSKSCPRILVLEGCLELIITIFADVFVVVNSDIVAEEAFFIVVSLVKFNTVVVNLALGGVSVIARDFVDALKRGNGTVVLDVTIGRPLVKGGTCFAVVCLCKSIMASVIGRTFTVVVSTR